MTPRERIGAYARVVERVLDEVCAAQGELSDGPRLLLWALLRWATERDDASLVEIRALYVASFADANDLSGDHAFGWMRGAVLNLASFAMGEPDRGLDMVTGCVRFALARLGLPAEVARARATGEFARELMAHAPRAAA